MARKDEKLSLKQIKAQLDAFQPIDTSDIGDIADLKVEGATSIVDAINKVDSKGSNIKVELLD